MQTRILDPVPLDPQLLLTPGIFAPLEDNEAEWLLPALRVAIGSLLFER